MLWRLVHLTQVLLSATVDNTEKKGVAHAVAIKGFEGKTCLQFVPHREKRAYLSVEPKYG